MLRVAEFEKVSLDRFKEDWLGQEFTNTEMEIIDIYNNIKKPSRATTGSAGYDIFSPIHIMLEPNNTIVIPTGLRCKIESGWFMSIYPRSGLGFKYGMKLSNTVGIIDSDYYFSDNEGHIFIKLVNDSVICKTLDVEAGRGFAQCIFMKYGLTVDDKVETLRNGGFGSTDYNKGK